MIELKEKSVIITQQGMRMMKKFISSNEYIFEKRMLKRAPPEVERRIINWIINECEHK